jgi:hypothetical protein
MLLLKNARIQINALHSPLKDFQNLNLNFNLVTDAAFAHRNDFGASVASPCWSMVFGMRSSLRARLGPSDPSAEVSRCCFGRLSLGIGLMRIVGSQADLPPIMHRLCSLR